MNCFGQQTVIREEEKTPKTTLSNKERTMGHRKGERGQFGLELCAIETFMSTI